MAVADIPFEIIDGIAEINQEPDVDEPLKWPTKLAGSNGTREYRILREDECRKW